MSSSETPFSTADSDVSSVGNEGSKESVENRSASKLPSCPGSPEPGSASRFVKKVKPIAVPEEYRQTLELDYLFRRQQEAGNAPIASSSSSSSSFSDTKRTRKHSAGKPKVKMHQVTWNDFTKRTPTVLTEDDLVYKVQHGDISLDDAIAIDAEAIAKELDLRPGVKVLSHIPLHRWGLISELDGNFDVIVPTRLNLAYLDVQELGVLKAFPFVIILDLTGNKLRYDNMDFLQYLPNLKSLNVDDNRLYSCDLPSPKLEWLSIRSNRLVWLDPFTYPELKYLYIDDNRLKFIHNLDEEFCPNLIKVSAGGNRIRTTLAQWSCSIRFLYMVRCKIRKLEGLENLVNLEVFHLRGCRVKKLKGLTWHNQSLDYLNLRDNKISNVRQFKRLRPLPRLKILITTGCPFEENKTEEKARWAILYAYKGIRRLNKKVVTDEELANRDLGKDDIDNDEDSSDDAIAEDSEEEEEGPPVEWEDDDDPDAENFDPKRTHVQVKKYTRRSQHPLLDHYMEECKAYMDKTMPKTPEDSEEEKSTAEDSEGESEG